jgi:uncharacterized protein involved in outer membrane biogenesis
VSARSVTATLLVLFGIILLIGICAAIAITKVDPRPYVERYVSKLLDRQIRVDQLTIHWGNPLHVEIRNLRLANAKWGSVPEMLRVDYLAADIDVKALWSGVLRYQRLDIVKPVLVLERNAEGVGNWRFGSNYQQEPASQDSGLAVVPKNRRQFPSLLDFALKDGLVTYRTYSGHVLKIRLDQIAIAAAGENALVDIEGSGAYNDADIRLKGQAQSFTTLRDTSVPFGTSFSLRHQSAKLDFTGTMREPLDFEGVQGPVRIAAEKLSDILGMFHLSLPSDPEARLTADLSRQGNLWSLMDAKGSVAASNFTGKVTILEGNRGGTDDVSADLTFDRLDVDALLTEKPADGQPQKPRIAWTALPLQTPDASAPRVTAKVAAKSVAYGNLEIANASVDGRAGPDDIALTRSQFTLADSQFYVAGTVKPAGDGSHLAASLSLEDGKIERFINLLFGEAADVQGRVDGGAVVDLQGATLGEALKHSNGTLVLSLTEGRIARALLEKMATDLRALFRRGKGTARISCMLGVVQLKKGIGTLKPFKLRTPEANLNAQGSIDLSKQSLDLLLQSEAESTGFFALDVPLQISGNWNKPKIRPGRKSVPEAAGNAGDKLPASLQALVESNPCRQP